MSYIWLPRTTLSIFQLPELAPRTNYGQCDNARNPFKAVVKQIWFFLQMQIHTCYLGYQMSLRTILSIRICLLPDLRLSLLCRCCAWMICTGYRAVLCVYACFYIFLKEKSTRFFKSLWQTSLEKLENVVVLLAVRKRGFLFLAILPESLQCYNH